MPVISCSFNPAARRAAVRPRARRGFSLIEVLATILMVGIVVPIVMQASSAASAAADSTRRRSEAIGHAERKLNELIATGQWRNGSTGGQVEGSPDYEWTAIVENWSEANVQHLAVEVAWKTPGRAPQVVQVATLVYENNAQAGGGTTGTTGGTGATGGTTP